MKVREELIRKFCGSVLSRWKDRKLIVPKTAEEVLLAKMVGEVVKDFQREEALDREAEALLEKHSREVDLSQANSRLLFQKIKSRLAGERGIVL